MAVKPKLVMKPTGVKASKLYSVLPSDGVGDFDFSRSGSATRINKDGLIETVSSNVPRLNYPLIDGVVSGCPSLLLESARTNLFTYSEDFSASIWGLNGSATREANATISPDGTLNAYKITSNGGNLAYGQGGVVSENSTYEISFFAKKGTDNIIQITESFYFGSSTIFDLESGSITSGNGTIESYSNDWYRCSVSYTYGSGQTILSFNIKNTGSGYFYLFGFQGEQGSYPTSYIPTSGSQTTRSAETCNNSGDVNTFNDSEGVLYTEVSSLTEGGDGRRITLSDGSISDRLLIETDENANTIKFFIAGGGTSRLIATSTTQVQKKSNKLALNYNGTNAKAYINGFSIGEITNANTITGLNTLDLADWDAFTYPYFGKVKQLQYFDTALTDTDLEELTSWTSFNEMAESQLYSIQ